MRQGGGGGQGAREGATAYLDVVGERFDMFSQVVVLFHILLGGAIGAVGPGPRPEGLQACLALCQLLQSFWVAALRMELGKAALQHVLNLYVHGCTCPPYTNQGWIGLGWVGMGYRQRLWLGWIVLGLGLGWFRYMI